MESLRIAMVGAGRAGTVHAENLAEATRWAVVAAVVDESREAADRMASRIGCGAVYASLEAALQHCAIDAVVITTPTYTHRSLVEQAASANKHVFCEKPMALSVEDCDAMIRAAAQAQVMLQIGFMRRFQPEFAEAKKRIDDGEIGDPMIVKSLTRGPGLPPPWARDLRRSNGMLAEVNSHDFDSVRWLAGSDIARVYAEVANRKGAAHGIDDPDFFDNAVVTLRFASGAIGTIDGTCPADYGYDARMEVLGTRGLLIIGSVLEKAVLEIRDRETGAVQPSYRTWPERFREGYRAEMRAFVKAVLDGTPPLASGEDGRQAVRGVLAANRSWQEQRPITLLPEGTR